jgi:hypothetical protein
VKLTVVKLILAFGCLHFGAYFNAAWGDDGVVRLSECKGAYKISVFTSPTPFRAGIVDISVLIQDAVKGELIPDVETTVRLIPIARTGEPIVHAATAAAATNKIFRAAVVELPQPGRWEVEVDVAGKQGFAQVCFQLTAADRIPQWPALWPWIGWPIPVIVLFTLHQWRAGRRSGRWE